MRNEIRTVKDYLRHRAVLVARGLSVAAWARSKGYPPSSVYSAVKGERVGPKSRRILKELEDIHE